LAHEDGHQKGPGWLVDRRFGDVNRVRDHVDQAAEVRRTDDDRAAASILVKQ